MRLLSLLALTLVLPLSACDSDSDDDMNNNLSTITELVVANAQLSTLEAAVIEAELDDDLASAGPFTVFAPTDAAFGDLLDALDATPEELLARDDLGSILSYHVVSGMTVRAADISVGQTVATLGSGVFTIVAAGTGLGIDTDGDGAADARIITTDVEASNGVVHLIDAVLLP